MSESGSAPADTEVIYACGECDFDSSSRAGIANHRRTHDQAGAQLPEAKEGDRGPHVRALQAVIALYGGEVNITGVFNAETARGVRSAQANLGVETTGVVDGETWQALLGIAK